VFDLPLGPLRETDFPANQSACLAWAAKILVQTRLPAKYAEVFSWGIEINQSRSGRPWSAPDSKKIERCHLVDKVELDPELGVYALCTQRWHSEETPPNAWIGICPWLHLPVAALHLRTKYLLGNKYAGFNRHLSALIVVLGLTERPINDQRLPSYAQARHGTLFRFDRQTAGKVRDYFIFDETDEGELVSTPLDGSCWLVCAYSSDSNEPLRAILTVDSWSAAQAEKELRRWLHTYPRKEIGTL
jgi:hypothetical protein